MGRTVRAEGENDYMVTYRVRVDDHHPTGPFRPKQEVRVAAINLQTALGKFRRVHEEAMPRIEILAVVLVGEDKIP